jgi:hypothetical protein
MLSVFSAFAVDSTIALNRWQSLKGSDYKVDYRRGIKNSSGNITALVSSGRLWEVDFNSKWRSKIVKGQLERYLY